MDASADALSSASEGGRRALFRQAATRGLIWRDWLGLNQKGASENNTEYPALVVTTFSARSLNDVKAGLWGFGYDFDNMKARCWHEHHFPLLFTENIIPDLRKAALTASRNLSLLRSALKEARFSDAKGARGDFSFIDIDFWHLTQGRFLELIRDLENGQNADERLKSWQTNIWLFTRSYFDGRVFTNPYESTDLKRIMLARKNISPNRRRNRTRKPPKLKSRRLLNEYCEGRP